MALNREVNSPTPPRDTAPCINNRTTAASSVGGNRTARAKRGAVSFGGAESTAERIMWSVLLVFLSSLDRNLVKGNSVSSALDAKKPNKETFCSKVSSIEDKFLYEVSDGVEVVRSLVTTAGTLVNCVITGNSAQVMSFTRECIPGPRDGTEAQQVQVPYERLDEARQLCERFTKKFQQNNEHMDQMHRRAKRGFTYPGTLWCGAGNMADNYNQLGHFAKTDSCCRTHDHCPHVIHTFSSNYGYTNFKWHSISHCDCDEALKACLRKVNDTSSRIVGQAFFNVIEAPCFYLTYEEQCVERHWYGLCKKLEKRPIAVLKEAVPYDFGGIDVIDELTVAPSRKKDSNISGEKVQPEITTQSPVSQPSSPEEPSLRNVVTAAEDFIKVLATVSTSQSSTADSDKGDTDSKKKKTSEKKKKSKKTKGKGRKKKKKQEAVVNIEDSGAVSLSSPKPEKAMSLSNFISESQSPEQLVSPSIKVSESEYKLGGKDETSNEVMKDAPALDEEADSITPPNPTKKPAKNNFPSTVPSPTGLPKGKRKWLKNRQRTKVKTARPPELGTTAETSKPQDQTVVSTTKRTLNVHMSPIDIPKVKRNRSKLRQDEEERKKRLKASAASASAVNENVENRFSKEGNTPLTTPPKQQSSQEADGGRVTLPNPSFSVLKRQRQRSKEKGITKKKRKGLTLDEQLSQINVEEAILPTPTGTLISPAVTTTVSWFTVDTQTTAKWQLFTSTTSKPSVTKGLLNKRRGKTKIKKAQSSALRGPKAMTVQRRPSKPTAVTGAVLATDSSVRPPQPTTTAANTALSPMQLTIEKVKEQFERKRKRKVAVLLRHQ